MRIDVARLPEVIVVREEPQIPGWGAVGGQNKKNQEKGRGDMK